MILKQYLQKIIKYKKVKLIKVVAAIIFYNNKILVTQRKFSKNNDLSLKYEFPGGKVKQDESNFSALIREIYEELELIIEDIKYFDSYDFNYPKSRINLNFFLCNVKKFNLKLNIHQSYKLVDIKEIKKLDWLKADYKVLDKLQKYYL